MSDTSQPVSMDPELSERLGALHFAVEGVVEGLLSGQHRSRRRGGGLVFAEHRDYRPGDDPRTLDWRAYARSDHYRTKHFEHEAQLRAVLALDVSGSMAYGSERFAEQKQGYAAMLLGALAHVLLRQGDAAGVARFHNVVEQWLPPRGGSAHLSNLLRTLALPVQGVHKTRLSQVLSELTERAGRRGAIVIASDLLDEDDDGLDQLGRLVARGHRVVVLHVLHPNELDFPFDEAIRFVGTEGEQPVEVDARSIAQDYRQEVAQWQQRCRAQCAATGAHYVLARTDRPALECLTEAARSEQGSRWG